MAVTLQSYEVSELCLGKPALYWLPITATVADALKALKQQQSSYESELAVWNCRHNNKKRVDDDEKCTCLGKVCMVDIICYLSTDESLRDPASALTAPLTTLLPRDPTRVQLVDPHSRILHALELILDGAQNLIVPIERPKRLSFNKLSLETGRAAKNSPASHEGEEFRWITQEDVLRFFLGFLGAFSPLPSRTIDDLGIVNTEILMVEYDKPVTTALNMIKQASYTQTAIAVVEQDPLQGPKFVGEISPYILRYCDETVALALAELSSGDFMAYVDCGETPKSLVKIVRNRINQKMGLDEGEQDHQQEGGLTESHQLRYPYEESSQDDFYDNSPTGSLNSTKTLSHSCSFKSNKLGYAWRSCRASPVTCKPWSSLVAVIVQALAHRVNYVWVIDEDSNLVGIVTFLDILGVFWGHMQTLGGE